MSWQNSVIRWVRNHPYAGYDPYDLLSLNSYTQSLMYPFSQLTFPKKVAFLILTKSNDWFPLTIRKLLRIPKKVHPTYLGLLLHAELNFLDEYYNKEKIIELKRLLKEQRISSYKNYCWGTPFEWRSGDILYTEGTPFTVVTAWIGEAFLTAYRQSNQPDDLEVCISIADFFIHDLIIEEYPDDRVCFSYSPLTKSDINNSNLMVAAFLAQLGQEIGNSSYIQWARKAVNFSVSTQLDNGLIPYNGNDTCVFNDSYHSSYELKSLFDVIQVIDDPSFKTSFEKYLEYYLNSYFQKDYSITKYANRPYPVDGTAIADGLILLKKIAPHFPDLNLNNYIQGINNLIEKEWLRKDDSIKHKKISKKKFTNITYTRWIMGWFALAASYNLKE